MAKILVTGAAGFIGAAVCHALLARGDSVIGVDNLSDYYDVGLKQARLARLAGEKNFVFRKADIADRNAMLGLGGEDIAGIVHLAAQPGVRYSLENPFAYVTANVMGQAVMLELARASLSLKHFVYASSSSVYGANKKTPFAVGDAVDHPNSLYAATKRADELFAHTYAHLYGIACTGLRFFTVYGPWGRPDMAMFIFARAILAGEPIQVFNEGRMRRDFTYIDDIVEGVVRVCSRVAEPDRKWNGDKPDPGTSQAPYRLYNIGNNNAVELLYLIEVLENCLGRKAEKTFLPMQPGDVPATFADVSDLTRDVGFKPSTSIEEGVRRFTDWYMDYYNYQTDAAEETVSQPINHSSHDHFQLESNRVDRAALPQ